MKTIIFLIGTLFFSHIVFAQKSNPEQKLLKSSEFLLKLELNNPQSYKRIHYTINKEYLCDSLFGKLSLLESEKNYHTLKLKSVSFEKEVTIKTINQLKEIPQFHNSYVDSITHYENLIAHYKYLINSCDKSLSFLSDTIKIKEKLSSFGIYTTYIAIFIGGLSLPTGIAIMTSISSSYLMISTSINNHGKNAFLGKKYKSLRDRYNSIIGLKKSYNKNIESCEYHIKKLRETYNTMGSYENTKREVLQRQYDLLNQDMTSHTNIIKELTKKIDSLNIKILNTNSNQVRRYDVWIQFQATNMYGGIITSSFNVEYDSSFGYLDSWASDKTGVFR